MLTIKLWERKKVLIHLFIVCLELYYLSLTVLGFGNTYNKIYDWKKEKQYNAEQ